MKINPFATLALAGITCLLAGAGCKINSATTPPRQATCVLVHGAWGGGWDWRHVDDLLTADDHKVFRATLTGLGERSHLSSTNIALDTHIQDVVNVILWENLHDVVLVGHSYGGMVITGVADQVPDRIRCLVYVDALLPENGESVNAVVPTNHINQKVQDGYILPVWVTGSPPPPHDVPMPAKCFSQPIILTNQAAAQKIPSTYILTVDAGAPPADDLFYKFYRRAQSRGWPAWIMEGDHNVQRSHSQELVRLIEKAGQK